MADDRPREVDERHVTSAPEAQTYHLIKSVGIYIYIYIGICIGIGIGIGISEALKLPIHDSQCDPKSVHHWMGLAVEN